VSSLIATRACAIVALSQDEALLRALTVAMLEHAAIITSASADRFIDQLAGNNAQVALLDAASVPSPIGAFTARLREQFPQLLIVVTGSSALQRELRAQIADGTIFRFAPKPASAQRLKVFLHAALGRNNHEHEQLAAADPAAAPPGAASWLQRLWRAS
jgi:DNA-binding NtrC family response regulator